MGRGAGEGGVVFIGQCVNFGIVGLALGVGGGEAA